MNKKIKIIIALFTISASLIGLYISYNANRKSPNAINSVYNDRTMYTPPSNSKQYNAYSNINRSKSTESPNSSTSKSLPANFNNTISDTYYPSSKKSNENNSVKQNNYAAYSEPVSSSNYTPSKKAFSIDNYFSHLESKYHTIQSGETLSTFAHLYEPYCNPNSTVKLISLLNNLSSPNNLEIGTQLRIPEKAIKNGTLYTVVSGDTWFKISEQYYPEYTTDSIMNFIVKINNLPNNDLPLGEKVFLPKV